MRCPVPAGYPTAVSSGDVFLMALEIPTSDGHKPFGIGKRGPEHTEDLFCFSKRCEVYTRCVFVNIPRIKIEFLMFIVAFYIPDT